MLSEHTRRYDLKYNPSDPYKGPRLGVEPGHCKSFNEQSLLISYYVPGCALYSWCTQSSS